MSGEDVISDFLAQKRLALVGVSRSGKKIGNMVLKELNAKGYRIFPVHPEAAVIDGHSCSRSLSELPEKVGGAILVIPPAETEKVVREAAKAGIPRVWMQQGSESETAIRFCEENGIAVTHGQCIMMFAEPAAFYHRVHRWIWRLLGKVPR
jgi:hypothetical protein